MDVVAGTSVLIARTFHNPTTGAVEDPTSPTLRYSTDAGTNWSSATTPTKRDSETGYYGHTIDTTGMEGKVVVWRLEGTVATSVVQATSGEFTVRAVIIAANMTQISGDTTAADNLEAMFDGTGYSNANAPSTQSAVSGIPAAILAAAYEGVETVQGFLRLARAILLGKTTDGGTKFRDKADAKNRVVATIDGSNNRTTVTTDDT